MSLPDPITRREQYLNIVAGGTGSLPPHPITREEQYLAAIAEGSPGPGGGLPPVTSADNGKVLAVEDGAWAAADKSPLIVTYTITGEDMPYPLSYSHTLAQIAEAQAAGREVLGTLTLNGIRGTLAPIVRMAQTGVIVYTGVLNDNGASLVQVEHTMAETTDPDTGEETFVERARLYVVPLSTYSMQFDSTTGTLYITNVPEAN